VVGGWFVGRVGAGKLVVVVIEIPLYQCIFVGQLCPFRQLLSHPQHLHCRVEVQQVLLRDQSCPLHSSEVAQLRDEACDGLQEVVVERGAFTGETVKYL
jgi:hypothetical protein